MERDDQACEKCGSKQTYIRLKDKTRVCRSCGHVQEIEVLDG